MTEGFPPKSVFLGIHHQHRPTNQALDMRLFVEVGRVLERTGTTAFVRNNLPDAFGRAVELVFDSEADAVAFRLAFTMTCYRALHEATRKDHSAAVTQK